MSDLSPREKLQAFSSDIVLKAGAGSGKTYTLVNFYLDLLNNRVDKLGKLDCGSIVALTFTEKAAEEMRERIGQELQKEELFDQLDHFDQATISTIHGFCSGILREFALEAGIDPDFEAVDGQDLLYRAALETALAGLDARDPDILRLNRLLDFSGSGGLVKTLTTSLSLARTMGQSIDQILADIGERRSRIPELEAELKLALTTGLARISGMEFKAGLKSTPRMEALAEAAARPVDEDLQVLVAEQLKGSVPKQVKPIKEDLLKVLEDLTGLGHEPDALEAAESAARFMGRVEQAYSELKFNQGVLDFDDLQLIARNLLMTRPDIRQRLKERFRLILIDEFQDTNPLQWDIFTCLRERLDRADPVPVGTDPARILDLDPARLVVVGDAKQSIYRFRGAEVGLFADLVNRLEGENPAGIIELPCNWRSQPGLVSFFNAFYEWTEDGLDSSRPQIQAWHQPQKWAKPGPVEPCVEFLETEKIGNQAQTMELEARALAARIRWMVDSPNSRPGREGGYKFEDFAILLRKSTHLGFLENALQGQGVPFMVEQSGSGLKTPEVQDLINLLAYLVRPDDTYLAACLLRSPLITLSDDSLVLMALNGGLAKGLAQPESARDYLPAGEADRLAVFQDLLQELRAKRDRVSAAELIEAALEKTDLAAVLLAGHQGREKLAAIQGFIEAVRNLSSGSGQPGLPDLISRLRPLDDSPPPTVEPAPLEGLDAVKIMTIHKAKGLQFPVVVLPQSFGRGNPGYNPVIYRPGMGLAIQIKRAEDSQRVSSYSYLELAQAQKEAETAEAHRLLYVALTRAEEKLIITGPQTPPAKNGLLNNWKKQLDAFRESPLAQGLFRVQLGDSSPVPVRQALGRGLISEDYRTTVQGRAVVARVLHPPKPPGRMEISVSHLEDLELCPRLYYRSRLLGQNPWLSPDSFTGPAENPTASDQSGFNLTGLSPTDRGLWFHKAVEMMNLAQPGAMAELARVSARVSGLAVSLAEIDRMGALLELLILTPVFAPLTGSKRVAVRRELEFSLSHKVEAGELIINGEIDLLALANPRPLILDWKLARPGRADYSFQMQTYGLAAGRAISGTETPILPGLALVYVTAQGVETKPVPFEETVMNALTARLDELAGLLFKNGRKPDPDIWSCSPAAGRQAECPFFKGGCCG